jgi:hypothetical protein
VPQGDALGWIGTPLWGWGAIPNLSDFERFEGDASYHFVDANKMVGRARYGEGGRDSNSIEFDGIRIVKTTIFLASGKWSGAGLDHFVGVNKMIGNRTGWNRAYHDS